jgi:aminopeptidase N
MAIHQIRLAMGDDAFFETLRTWVESRKYGNGNIAQFQALAEQISGVDLDAVFTTWLYTAGKPALPASASASAKAAPSAAARPRPSRSRGRSSARWHDELSARKS